MFLRLKTLVKRICSQKIIKNRKNGNKFDFNKCFLWHNSFYCSGSNNVIEANESQVTNCCFHFYGSNNHIIIENDCMIDGVDFWIEDNNNIIKIMNNCFIHKNTQVACCEGTTIAIGKNVLISSDVHFTTTDSHSILDGSGQRINYAKNINIGNNVWIGARTTLLKGSSLSDNSVLGCGSILTKAIYETNVIVAGNPAKIIKRNINWDIERKK